MSNAVNTIPEQMLPTVKRTNIDADVFISVNSGFYCGRKYQFFNLLYSHRNEVKQGELTEIDQVMVYKTFDE